MAKYYITYYEEYPIYEPAEGGYYYAGNQACSHYGFDNFYEMYKYLPTVLQIEDMEATAFMEDATTNKIKKALVSWNGSMPIAVDYGNEYVGSGRSLRIETEAGFKSAEHGWHPYE